MVTIPTDTKYYIKVFDNIIDNRLCKNIVKELKKEAIWNKHKWNTGYDNKTGVDFYDKKDDHIDKELSTAYLFNTNDNLLLNNLYDVLKRYYSDTLKNFSWVTNWQGYTKVRYNRYKVNEEMLIHCDHIYTVFEGARRGIPTLTILGALNDDYEGGNLYIIDEEIKLKAGSVVVFPSLFMYPHVVKPVTKGTRYSYVSWVWG